MIFTVPERLREEVWPHCPIRDSLDVSPDTPEWKQCKCGMCMAWRMDVSTGGTDEPRNMTFVRFNATIPNSCVDDCQCDGCIEYRETCVYEECK
jgi:hypothetical protein